VVGAWLGIDFQAQQAVEGDRRIDLPGDQVDLA
jgi:hypothetical protein